MNNSKITDRLVQEMKDSAGSEVVIQASFLNYLKQEIDTNLSKISALNMIHEDIVEYVIDFYDSAINKFLAGYEKYIKANGVSNKKHIGLIKRELLPKKNKTIQKIRKIESKGVKFIEEARDLILKDFKHLEVPNNNIVLTKEFFKNLVGLFLFVGEQDIDSLIRAEDGETSITLDKDNLTTIEQIRDKMSILVSFYLNYKERYLSSSALIIELKKNIEELGLKIKELEKEIKTLRRQNGKIDKENTEKLTNITRLQQGTITLKTKIIELEGIIESLRNPPETKEEEINQELLDDLRFYEEEAGRLELEVLKLKEKIEFLSQENKLLSIKLSGIDEVKQRLNNFSQIDSFLDSCEVDIDSCKIDNMLKYIAIIDCPITLKQNAIKIIFHFIDEIFLKNTTKGASSSTRDNEGTGGGKYANNFINPVLNFIKEKGKNMGTQAFLEFITNMNWRDIINEYNQNDNYITKKQRVIKNISTLFKDDDKVIPIFEALKDLGEKLKGFSIGDIDLVALIENIEEANNNTEYEQRELRKIFIETIAHRRKRLP